jgi:8-oxo-dGTP pyrophosphatase MutT (NUDIX family)
MNEAATVEMQCAALPVRKRNGGVEVLLVTSRQTKRWVIPKGWPIDGLTPPQSAAREALEEAGVEGRIESKPIGEFHYGKRRKDGTILPCNVEVFRMDVSTEHEDWHEKGQRVRQWMPAAEASRLVAEPELAALLRSLG